jgi:outer membrane autotransporter protein
MVSTGYSFSTDSQRSDYFYLSTHLSFDVGNAHRFYPVFEMNWFHYTTDGSARFISGEGRDLINFGSLAKGSSMVTGAVGGRVKLTRNTELGAAYEMPMIGNEDFFDYRFTVDFIWRY